MFSPEIPNQSGGRINNCFVPAWIFSRHEEADNDHDDPYTSQLVILDAVTGDLIDPVLLSESLNITADEDWGFIAEN